MSGKFNTVVISVEKLYSSAFYVHCIAHNPKISVSYASCFANTAFTRVQLAVVIRNITRREKVIKKQLWNNNKKNLTVGYNENQSNTTQNRTMINIT